MSTPEFDAETCFGRDGQLAREVPGYHPREEQGAMAAAVWDALRRERTLAVEAGTGVGKTFAYLMPVLASGRKTLVATGTRHLQDQLFRKDLPVALKSVHGAAGSRVCLLKGRANYLCLHRYQAHVANGLGRSPDEPVQKLQAWADETETGDLAELDCPEDDPIVPAITSTLENCLGKKCPEYEDCFVVRARERARRADLVIANHHLFAADLALREDSLGELLPDFEVLVFDEAHRLAEVLELFWSSQLSAARMQQLCRDAETVAQREPDGNQALILCVHMVRRALKQVTVQVHAALEGEAPGERIPPPPEFADWARPLVSALEALLKEVEERRQDGPDMESLAERCGRLTEELAGWPSGEPECCEYLNLSRKGFTLHQVPIDISGIFAQARTRYAPRWVFTSATLSVGGNFDYFLRKLGLGAETDTLQLDSPFDFQAQTLLYLPPGLPDPRTPEYNETMLEAVLPLLEQLRGRTFLLFTSLRAMEAAGQWLEDRLDCTLLKQGDAPRRQLLKHFTERPDAVLLGSVGFWEGVDIRGPALSCVIIDKIPFVSHTDLLYQARMNAIREAGGDPFRQLQLPRAALMLKQGVGRLIRSVMDQGVAVIADPRLQSQWYGRHLTAGLPDMPVSTDLGQTLEFLQERVA
ncbi:MAG: ATP-dependent DNA helicase [Gammaproteobacteria bacterium]|nr:ATP-dependent DNA helicase [Gammaproteobacteria bacterium]